MSFETAVLIGVLVGPFIFLADTVFRRPTESYEGFHFGGRAISPSDFVDTTTVYALQLASITLFATWGFIHGLWAMLVPIFWGCGYLLIVYLIRKGALNSLIRGAFSGTVHQFIANQGKFRLVAFSAGVITLFGLAGPAMFEAKFVADLVEASLASGEDQPAGLGTLLMFGFVFICAIYMIHSGFAGVVRTDRVQLGLGYGGFQIIFAIILYFMVQQGIGYAKPISAACLLLAIVVFVAKYWLDRKQGRVDISSYLVLIIGVLAYGWVWLLASLTPVPETAAVSIGMFLQTGFGQPFPILALVSLAIANGLYQIVDVGHWQRLLSLNIDDENEQEARNTLARSTLAVAFYSPASWALAVLFGMALRHYMPGGDPYAIITQLMVAFKSDVALGPWLALIFIVAVTSIMMSTVDSLISGTAFTVHNDILGLFTKKLHSVSVARIVTLGILIMYPIYYLWMLSFVKTFDAVLYISWSGQIALFPAVISALFGWRAKAVPMLTSMAVGVLGAAIPLIQGRPELVYEVSPLYALLGASVTFAVLHLVMGKLDAEQAILGDNHAAH